MKRIAALLVLALAQDPPPDPRQGPPPDPALVALAVKCGRQIQWRRDLAEALSAARAEGRLVFGYVYDRSRSSKFGNKFKDDFLRAGPFIDEDLVWALNRKFIPLRLYLDGIVAEELTIDADGGPRTLKLNDVTVPGFIFIRPDGRIVSKFDSIAVASSELIFHVLRSTLKKFPDYDKPSAGLAEQRKKVEAAADDLRARYRLGLEHLKDGGFESAIEVFGEVIQRGPGEREAVESAYRSASAWRRLRKPKEALESLARARKLNEDVGAKIWGDIALEEALLELRQGRAEAGAKILVDALQAHPKSNRAPEMSYLVGAVDLLADRADAAKERWTALTKSNPENPWAWKAAAELLERGPLSNGWEDLAWLPEDVIAGGTPASTERKRPPEERPQAIRDGIDYLLRHQRADGSWSHVKSQFAFTESVTVLGALALWECRDIRPDENAAARAKALAYFDRWMERKAAPGGMGLWPWELGAHVHLRLARDQEGDLRKAHLAKAEACLEVVKKAQLKDGSWTYGGGPTSFVTAAAILSFRDFKDLGGEVDEAIVTKGIDGLVTMKDPERETYWYTHRASDEFDHGAPEGAAGRGPLCYAAELAWGRCDAARFEWASKMFIDHRNRLMRVRKATDWHAGKFANAPYFFFYDYYYATETFRHLKPELRAAYAKEITKDLLAIGEIDGSWIDWHIAGKAYGAAMGVLCLRNCERLEKAP